MNQYVHLNTFYQLQSIHSRNFGRIKRYGNPPNLLETRSFCLLTYIPHAILCPGSNFQGEKIIRSTIVFISSRSICCNQPIAAISVILNVMEIPQSY